MAEYVEVDTLQVDAELYRFVVDEALPGSGTSEDTFWKGLDSLVKQFAHRNAVLLCERERLQIEINGWHRSHAFEVDQYRAFLQDIGYLLPQGPEFVITTKDVDLEIAEIAGPQLIVPVMNARYALNAANARWGSIYDALYGTDALGSAPPSGPYDPHRGAQVIAWVRMFLDEVVPLDGGSHATVDRYSVVGGRLVALESDCLIQLSDPSCFVGYLGNPETPSAFFLRHHGLHLEVVIDAKGPIGSEDRAGIADVVLESAVTSIMDCEDSVATVDAFDKVAVYRNWLGLMKGDLTSDVTKNGRTFTRKLAKDREIMSPVGAPITLPGRALMLVRNVGHFTLTNAVLDEYGGGIPEGLLDALMTVLVAKHDLVRGDGAINSRHGSVYVVKPKMHGPKEVKFFDEVLTLVETILNLPPLTVKIGMMDEERRTTVNLAECVRAAKERIAFINTGFLDRTGDEIHTSMWAGPMVRKADMKTQQWLKAYEDNNVDVGLACGLRGRAQIGKGMWAAPDQMAAMLKEKIAHPQAGANCAWVPSPTAATLHAIHYHRVDVSEQQERLIGQTRTTVDELLSIPVSQDRNWTDAEISEEVETNAQGILGYTVRWIDQGIGCSKVPDIHDVALMEDRATCRISSQHLANWLLHAVVDRDQVVATLRRIAKVVDDQNAGDEAYAPMSLDFDGLAFKAACELIFLGVEQPAGYTEPILHSRRVARKAQIEGGK
jgi:malate synthase